MTTEERHHADQANYLPVQDTDKDLKDAKSQDEPVVDIRSLGICKRLEHDRPFRRRFIHTVWLFWAFIGLGWMVGQMGPSFPDLRFIVDQELDVASWLFTSFSFGYLLGSLLGGIMYDRFNKLLVIFFSIIIMAMGSALLPWCTNFPLMLFVRIISGIGAGGLDTGGNADLMSLWDEEGRPYMQALHFCFGLGGIISPLVTEPFLATKTCVTVIENSTSIYTTLNTTMPSTTAISISPGAISTSIPCVQQFGETRVRFAYLITGILIITSSIPFGIMYINTKRSKKKKEMRADKSNQNRPQKLPLKLKIVFLVLLTTLMMMYCAVEDTFSGFMMTFCLQHLGWTKELGSYATSTHWAAFSIGRFSGIFLIRKFTPVQLLCGFIVLLICSFIGFFIVSVTMIAELIWVFIALAGFSMSVIFPCIFTWTEESILEVTGMISSFFLISASSGLLLNPLFLGYLMDNFAPITFAYLLLAESSVCFILFIIILSLVKRYVKTVMPEGIEVTVEMESLQQPSQELS